MIMATTASAIVGMFVRTQILTPARHGRAEAQGMYWYHVMSQLPSTLIKIQTVHGINQAEGNISSVTILYG